MDDLGTIFQATWNVNDETELKPNSNRFRLENVLFGASYMRVKEPRAPSQAMRLLILQTALYGTRHGCMSEFARDLGIGVRRLENVLADRTGLSGEMTRIVCGRTGVSADWLLFGNRATLSQEWDRRLRRRKGCCKKKRGR